ncbi:hypothetical protein EsDP_00004887 [Epichloe bromicola]|uniref:CN hydrolase domain-containing protein n=1 Tax=Epichloe bromicola TaxID=79588 RepID=A0ABQ0CT23_9HYPO
MRIACLQFAPQVGDVNNNLNRADSVLSKANLDDLDLLVLPELAFSGYNFKSLQDITPFLEHSGSGITSLWARTIALKYNCYVTVGYPEKVDVSPMWPTGPEYYNSAIVVNGEGETVANYRKSFLYYTDETWALEGNKGFYDGFLPGLGNTSIGICMDLNPYKFEAPWHAFEFAFHVLEAESNIVIVSMAWMTRDDPRKFSRMPNNPDMETLTYWITRLEPLIRAESEEEIIVVFCNRTGNEDEATYAGTSAVVGIQGGEVKIYGLLGRGEKELLVVDTNNAPYAKLVYRPDVDDSEKRNVVLDKTPTAESATERLTNDTADQTPADPETEKGNDMESGKTSKNAQESSTTRKRDQSTRRRTSKERSRSRGRSPGRQSTLSSGTKAPSAPLPTLPAKLAQESKESTARRRHVPAVISIPSPPGLVSQGDPAKSSASDTFNIPTPSAPSPTPMAIRPKLIIPQSPTSRVYSYLSDQPISAFSQRSIQSVRSDESEASVQTVRSNPRPPEDSTPYPHSGIPLSEYPTKKRIYGGNVTISRLEDDFTLSTPLDGLSPLALRGFWKPSENVVRTPISGGGWQPGMSIGRKPEPFPWPVLKPASRTQKRNGAKETPVNNVAQQDARQNNSQSPQSNTSSTRKKRSTSKPEQKYSSSKTDTALARPSSPKSRNASRSRMQNRSNSSLSQHDVAADISQRLETVSSRAESVNKMRGESASSTPVPDRPASRNHGVNPQKGQQTIHIAVSPSILNKEDQLPAVTPSVPLTQPSTTQQRPMSRADHERSNSLTTLDDRALAPSDYSNILGQTARTTSRGRQPGPKISPTHSDPTSPRRAPSVDSVAAYAYYAQFRNPSAQSHTHRGRRSSNGTNSRSRRDQVDLHEFERFESIVCPDCPVHGRSASTQNTSDATPTASAYPAPLSLHDGNREVGRSSAQKVMEVNASSSDLFTSAKNSKSVTPPHSQSEPDIACAAPRNASGRPRSTPAVVAFNPTTPKAMTFISSDIEPPSLQNGEVLSTA